MHRTRVYLVTAVLSLVMTLSPIIAVGLGMPNRLADFLLSISVFVATACALYALIGSLRELRRIRRSDPTSGDKTKLRITASTAATSIIVCFTLFGLTLIPNVEYLSPREQIINEFNSMAANAYQYRIGSFSKGGGNGSFFGWQIPKRMEVWSDGPTQGSFSYRTISVDPDSIVIEGRFENHEKGGVQVKIDVRGRLSNWRFYGDMDY